MAKNSGVVCPKYDVGGQAVMEGVMMRSPERTAVAVRQESGKIVVRVKPNKQLSPASLKKKMAKRLGKSAEDVMMGAAVVLALAMSIGLFFVLPTLIESWIRHGMTGGVADAVLSGGQKLLLNLVGGIIRIAMFIGYILLVRNVKEIKRTFMYHGAEHKSIHCLENGLN